MARALITCILTWLFLYVWEVWVPAKPTLYVSTGKIHMNRLYRYESEGLPVSTLVRTHVAMLTSPTLKHIAAMRVSMSRPELVPMEVQIDCQRPAGSTILTVSGIGSEPRYVQAYLNELLSEYLACRRKIEDLGHGLHLRKLSTHLITAQRDVQEIKQALEANRSSGSESDKKGEAYLVEKLAEAKDRQKFWTELITPFFGGCESTSPMEWIIEILELGQPAIALEEKLDPLSMMSRHPWRAITSFGVAAMLSVGLVRPRSTRP